MVRRLVLVAALLALTACGGRSASDRAVRAADTMEHLRGVRFSLEAISIATGSATLAGDLALRYRATGKLAPPDRLRLDVTEPALALKLEKDSADKLKALGVKVVENVDKSGFMKAAGPIQDQLATELGPHAVKILKMVRDIK